MPPKKGSKQKGGRKTVTRRKPRAPGMYGGSKVGDFFKGVYNKVLKPVGNFVKDKKIISTVLGAVPIPGVNVAGKVAGMVGLGHPHIAGATQPITIMPHRMAGRGRGHVPHTRVIRT